MTPGISPSAAHQPTDDERVAALNVGALVLSSRWPRVRAYIHVRIGDDRVPAYALVQWPGVVMVSDRFTGQVFARSKAGAPYSIDWSTTPKTSDTGVHPQS